LGEKGVGGGLVNLGYFQLIKKGTRTLNFPLSDDPSNDLLRPLVCWITAGKKTATNKNK